MRNPSLVLIAAAVAGCALQAQTPPKPEPDVLILADGEKLIGHLVQSNGSSVHFKSDILGDVNVDWSKVKELHAGEKFAVLTKEMVTQEEKRGRKASPPGVPEGTISATNERIDVATSAGTATIAVADAAHVLDIPSYEKAFVKYTGFFADWNGTITAGASLVEATQTSETFNGSVNLVRAIRGCLGPVNTMSYSREMCSSDRSIGYSAPRAAFWRARRPANWADAELLR
jgi:hypothetical protein